MPNLAGSRGRVDQTSHQAFSFSVALIRVGATKILGGVDAGEFAGGSAAAPGFGVGFIDQCLGHQVPRDGTVLGVFGQKAHDQGFERGRDLGILEPRRGWGRADVLRDDGHRLPRERHRAGDALVDHHAERIEVGPVVEPLSAGLLGAHVMRGAPDRSGFVHRLGHGREAEVGELGLIERREQDVGRLDVAMDHPLMVGVIQGDGHLGVESQPRGEGDVPPSLGKA